MGNSFDIPMKPGMQRDLIIIDRFYDDPDSVVEYARSLEYIYPYGRSDSGGQESIPWRTSKYRSAAECPFKSSQELRRALEFITGERIELKHWRREFPVDAEGYPRELVAAEKRGSWWNCSFHLKHWAEQRHGEGVHSHTDADSWSAVGVDGWAGIIYLGRDADLRSGLSTWRNRDPSRQHDWMTPPDNWQLVDSLGAVFNRLILHRGGIPHSGAPGWGDTVLNGRLFQTFFFRTRKVRTADSVNTEWILS